MSDCHLNLHACEYEENQLTDQCFMNPLRILPSVWPTNIFIFNFLKSWKKHAHGFR